ncbi:hypothetical protein HK096_006295, partial [Nowakowskiella sp. JEL0078]
MQQPNAAANSNSHMMTSTRENKANRFVDMTELKLDEVMKQNPFDVTVVHAVKA